ncbi:hypothetical protein LTR10_009599 [Elasticomyces elasticus]|uniref:Uncharacterized protein n=1 Tax=Elasticomyces elasticus TaxID=574655 RepID=A0AAN7W3D0_9PEZI|nr:hypothetical protein LTR10_009599 [Elasticomyces elasticus]KAK4971306.1 hypothetical protein LTR42_007032 [Elasticomyces elasticus]KAK5695530.1 hypothetical protein LTR97_009040 [Elasticomyces elasticus]
MEGTSQNKTLEGVCGILSSSTKTQAELTRTASKLANMLEETREMESMKQPSSMQEEMPVILHNLEPTKDSGKRLTDIVELLEMILLHEELPMQTVLLAQRVNKHFCDTIAKSKGLQEKLFFRPVSFASEHDSVNCAREVRLNPLFAKKSVYERFPMFVTRDLKRFTTRDDEGTLRLQVQQPSLDCGSSRACMDMLFVDSREALYAFQSVEEPLMAGSWSKMYLSQPPVEICVGLSWGSDMGGSEQDIAAQTHTLGRMLKRMAAVAFCNWGSVAFCNWGS